MSACQIAGCERAYAAKGYCKYHYNRVRLYGKAEPTRAIITDPIERFWSKVAKGDVCWEWTGSKYSNGYGQFWHEGRFIAAHRRAFEMAYGSIPEGRFIDHTCHNKACVNPRHLRVVTRIQNGENRAGANANNKSGSRGVHWHKGKRKWRAAVGHEGRKYQALFDTPQEADAWARAKRLEVHTHNDVDRLLGADR